MTNCDPIGPEVNGIASPFRLALTESTQLLPLLDFVFVPRQDRTSVKDLKSLRGGLEKPVQIRSGTLYGVLPSVGRSLLNSRGILAVAYSWFPTA